MVVVVPVKKGAPFKIVHTEEVLIIPGTLRCKRAAGPQTHPAVDRTLSARRRHDEPPAVTPINATVMYSRAE